MIKRKQQQILRTAEIMFNRFGVKKTAVDDIAHDARVAKATIYNYFGSKEGLLKALILEKIQQFDQKLQELLNANTQPIEKMKTLIREHIQLLIDNPFMKDSSLHDEDFSEELNVSEQHILQKIISEASKAGLLHNANSQQIINAMQLFLKGIEATLKNSITYSLDSLESSIDFISNSIFKTNKINGGKTNA